MLFCLVGFTGGHARNYQNALPYGRNFFSDCTTLADTSS